MFSHPDAQLPRAVGFSVAEGKIVELETIADPERVRPIAGGCPQLGSSNGAAKRGCSDEGLDPAGPLALLGVARPRPELVRGVVAVKNHGVSSGTAKGNKPFLCKS